MVVGVGEDVGVEGGAAGVEVAVLNLDIVGGELAADDGVALDDLGGMELAVGDFDLSADVQADVGCVGRDVGGGGVRGEVEGLVGGEVVADGDGAFGFGTDDVGGVEDERVELAGDTEGRGLSDDEGAGQRREGDQFFHGFIAPILLTKGPM